MQIGELAQPVQASLITAISLGLRFLCTDLFARSATAIFQLFTGEIDQCTHFTKIGLDVYQIPNRLASFWR